MPTGLRFFFGTVLSMRTEALGEYNTGCTVRVGYTDHMTCAEERKEGEGVRE
jgi:hypothetical protein